MSRVGGDRGQASVEHAAIVTLVLVVLAGAVVVGGGLGDGVVNAVHSGIRRAICVAGGDRCAEFHERKPCVIGRGEQRQAKTLSLAFLRVGVSAGLVREVRSDGSVLLTWYDDLETGGAAGIGADLKLARVVRGDAGLVPAVGGRVGRGGAPVSDGPSRDGGWELSLSASVGLALEGGWGRSWELPDTAAADRFAQRLLGGKDGPRATQALRHGLDALIARRLVPPPDVERVRLQVAPSGHGRVRGPHGLRADVDVFRRLAGEASRDRRTGRLAVTVALDRRLAEQLSGPLALDLADDLSVAPTVAITLDGERRPLELRMLGALGDRQGARRREVELRLDLTRPEVANALRGMLGWTMAGRFDRAGDFAGMLGRWAATEGAIEQREYRVGSRGEERGGSLALGLKLGYRTRTDASGWRLLRARTKPPGGIWESRTDCEATVRAGFAGGSGEGVGTSAIDANIRS